MMERLLVTVDAIEEGKASLLLRMQSEERPFAVVSLSMLPEGTVAGDILSLSFRREPELTKAARQRGKELQEMLLGR